jgi:hypothetical protein
MIRFPTHDGRGGFTLAVSSHQSENQSSIRSHHTAVPSQSFRIPSTKAQSTHASTSSSILDDALPRQPHSTTDLSQRIHAWAQEQQLYTRLRHKRRRLSTEDKRIQRHGLEGFIWRVVSRLINMDDELLQIVLGEKLVETQEQSSSQGASFWEGFIQRTAMEKHLASPFPSPQFQQIFRQTCTEHTPSVAPVAPSRPTRQAPTPWDPPRRQITVPQPTSSWSSLPTDPIQTAPFQPSPIAVVQSPKTESSHAAWGIEDNDILSTSTEVPDDYWDREITIPLVWHLVKNFISRRLPTRERSRSEGVRSCKEESIRGRWDDPDERGYYWHESVDGASSLGLGLGGLGAWAEV